MWKSSKPTSPSNTGAIMRAETIFQTRAALPTTTATRVILPTLFLTLSLALGTPVMAAEEINLLHEGATAVAHISGEPVEALKAKAIAARLIEEAERSG